jgi:hypothetical protein
MKTILQQCLLVSALLSIGIPAHAAGPSIDPSTLTLEVNGQPYFIRGMNYAPETRGWPGNALTSVGPQGQQHKNGAWLCSGTNEYAANDWQSACADNDLAGTLGLSTQANSLYNAALKTYVWTRDLGDMQKLGVNTIRLYDVQAGTAPSGSMFKNHTDFLNVAMQYGIRVIFPALTTYTNSQPSGVVTAAVTSLVKETCGNPAILAYNVGNEFPLGDANTVQNIKTAISIVRQLCPAALITYTDDDDVSGGSNSWPLNSQGISPALQILGNIPGQKGSGVDFFMVNEYRNDANGGLSAYDAFFQSIGNLTAKYKIPFGIGETGQYDNQQFSKNWYDDEWRYILKNSSAVHNVGALYFEYTDEPIKKGIANDAIDNGHQQFMGIVTAGWPAVNLEDQYVDVPNINKDASYSGIPSFTDTDGTTVSFPYSNQNKSGTGRYTMFSDATLCNYQTGHTVSPTSGPCAHTVSRSAKHVPSTGSQQGKPVMSPF